MTLLELAQNHPKEAEPVLEDLLSKTPDDLLFLRLMGLTKRGLGKLEEAIDYFKKAIHLEPNDPETSNQLALIYRDLGNLHLAILHMLEAASLNPTALYWTNVGKLFMEHKRLNSCEKALLEAVRLDPNFASAQYELSLLYGLQGRWSEFFSQYEWRLRYFDDLEFSCPIPIWDGSDLANKKLLVHGEQGAGDWIHFARYLSAVQERGAYVILYCPTALMSLFNDLADEVYDDAKNLPDVNYRCSVVSLPFLLGQQTD